MTEGPSREQVLRFGAGVLDSRVLLAALEARLFEVLGERSMMAPEICDHLDTSLGSVHDFLDTMVALGMLRRVGEGPEDSEYRSTADPVVLEQILRGRRNS